MKELCEKINNIFSKKITEDDVLLHVADYVKSIAEKNDDEEFDIDGLMNEFFKTICDEYDVYIPTKRNYPSLNEWNFDALVFYINSCIKHKEFVKKVEKDLRSFIPSEYDFIVSKSLGNDIVITTKYIEGTLPKKLSLTYVFDESETVIKYMLPTNWKVTKEQIVSVLLNSNFITDTNSIQENIVDYNTDAKVDISESKSIQIEKGSRVINININI